MKRKAMVTFAEKLGIEIPAKMAEDRIPKKITKHLNDNGLPEDIELNAEEIKFLETLGFSVEDEEQEPVIPVQDAKPEKEPKPKKAPKPKKEKESGPRKSPAKLDVFGNREGSQAFEINAQILKLKKKATIENICAEGLDVPRVKNHVNWLIKNGKAQNVNGVIVPILPEK